MNRPVPSNSINSLQTAELRPGDFHLRRDDRQLFGNVVQLGSTGGNTTRLSAMFVDTPTYPEPRLWQLEMRVKGGAMGDGGSIFSPILPNLGAYALIVTVARALDRDKGVATDVYRLEPSSSGSINALPIAFAQAQRLGIHVAFEGTGLVTVEFNATPVHSGERDPWFSTFINRVPQDDASQTFLAENQNRRQWFVQNQGTGPLYVCLGSVAANPAAASPRWTFVLPVGTMYEGWKDGYVGPISGVWDTIDAAAYAMVTEGT